MKRSKLWSAFHRLSLTELPKLWDRFLCSLAIRAKDTLLQQSVNQQLFEMLLHKHFTTSLPPQNTTQSPMSKDELNALQYACGYIPHILLKRYEKKSGRKYDKFLECLGDMAVPSENEHDGLLLYTREWISKVDRGGLFPLNEKSYLFFVSVEKQVRILLPSHMTSASASRESLKKSVIEMVTSNDDVQWSWTLISECIDSEEDAIELLQELVTLWVTVRGFSVTATWIETYKRESKKTTKKTPALRKGLSSSSENM